PLNDKGRSTFHGRFREMIDVDTRQCPLYQDITEGIAAAGVEYYLPLFLEELSNLLEYLPAETLVFRDRQMDQPAQRFWQDIHTRYEDRRYDRQRPVLPPQDIFLSPEEIFRQLKIFSVVTADQQTAASDFPALGADSQLATPLRALQTLLASHPTYRVLFCADSAGRREILSELLRSAGINAKSTESWQTFLSSTEHACIAIAAIDKGMMLHSDQLMVITEAQLLGRKIAQRRRR